jgi:hypothetical protein
MRQTAAILCLLFVAACATDLAEREREEREEREREKPVTRVDLSRAIDTFATGAIPETLRVRVEWERNDALSAAEIYGDGGGTWNDEVAIRLPADDVRAVVRALQQAHFGAMQERFGDPEPEFMKLKGKITLTAETTGKTVIQLGRGEQSNEFAALATQILDIAQRSAPRGALAHDLQSALTDIAAGRISPAALKIGAQRRDDRPGSDEPGWVLRTRNREAIARSFSNRGGYGPETLLLLSADEVRQLAAAVRDADPAALPPNLYAAQYTDVNVQVLNRGRDLQARRYGGVTAETHGAKQQAFDRLVEALAAIAQRAIREGKRVPTLE